tara:strand:- start:2815 stop:3981 length:1167 start_codon:yes stop_codon:yes gene_type:complete
MKDFWNLLKVKTSVIKDIGFLGSANIFGTVISGFFWFFLAKELGVQDYGEIQYYLAIAGMAYLISSLGTPNVIAVYVAKNIKIHPTLILISLSGGFIALTTLFALFQRIDLGILVLAFIIYDMTINYFLGKKLYAKYSKYFIIQKCLMVVFGIGFYYAIGVNGIIFGIATSYVIFIIIAFQIFRESKISFSVLRSRIGFVGNNYFERAVGGLKGEADKIIIAPLLGFEILGNYALGMQFYIILMAFSNIILKYLIPQEASNISNKKLKKLTIIISIGISILGILLSPIIIEIFFPEYSETVITVQILSLSVTPATLGYILISEFLGLEKGRYVLIGRIIALLTLITGMIILPNHFGIIGAASSFVLSSCAQTIFFIFAKISLKKQNLQ